MLCCQAKKIPKENRKESSRKLCAVHSVCLHKTNHLTRIEGNMKKRREPSGQILSTVDRTNYGSTIFDTPKGQQIQLLPKPSRQSRDQKARVASSVVPAKEESQLSWPLSRQADLVC